MTFPEQRLQGLRELADHLPSVMRTMATSGETLAVELLDDRLQDVLRTLIAQTTGDERERYQDMLDNIESLQDDCENLLESEESTPAQAGRQGAARVPAQRRREIADRITAWEHALVEGQLAEAQRLIPATEECRPDVYGGGLAAALEHYYHRPCPIAHNPGLDDGSALECSFDHISAHSYGGDLFYPLCIGDGRESDHSVEIEYDEYATSFGLYLRRIVAD